MASTIGMTSGLLGSDFGIGGISLRRERAIDFSESSYHTGFAETNGP